MEQQQVSLLKSFFVFKCGHNFHKKCIISQMDIESETSTKDSSRKNVVSLSDYASSVLPTRQRSKKKSSGLPLQSREKKQKKYICPLCKK